jgi:H+/gluconate symporter-like permease
MRSEPAASATAAVLGAAGLALDPLLQLLNQVLKERHDFVKICSQ